MEFRDEMTGAPGGKEETGAPGNVGDNGPSSLRFVAQHEFLNCNLIRVSNQ